MVFRKKGLLAVAVGSILGVASHNASATTFNMESPSPIKFAKEAKVDDSTLLVIPAGAPGAADSMGFESFEMKKGWGLNACEPFYLRLDLQMGGSSSKLAFAKDFPVAAVTLPDLLDGGVSTHCSQTDGGENDSFTIFKCDHVAVGAADGDCGTPPDDATVTGTAPDDLIKFTFGSGAAFNLRSKASNLNLIYTIHRNENINSSANFLYKKEATLLEFADSYEFAKASTTVRSVADVEEAFLKFTGDTPRGAVAAFKFSESKSSHVRLNGTGDKFTVATVAHIFDADNTELTVTGDFTMVEDSPAGSGKYTTASNVGLYQASGNNVCGTLVKSADKVDAQKAVFEKFNTITFSTTDTEYYVCVDANGASEIIAGSYSVVFSGKGKDYRSTTDTSATVYEDAADITLSDVGSITRSGTQLITPYFTTTDGYISRIILNNNGSRNINYIARIITDDGNTATAGAGANGVVEAGTNLQISAAELATFSSKKRGAAIFTFVGASADLQGVFQTVNLTSGEVQSITMQRPGGGRGVQ